MSKIHQVTAREVLDSRGKPTVEVEISSESGGWGRAIVPSGASTGSAEAHELRDGDRERYEGQGVLKAVENVRRVIAPALLGLDVVEQLRIDQRLVELDPSQQKDQLGGNAILGASLAAAHCAASVKRCALYEHLHELYRKAVRRGAMDSAPIDPPRMPLPMTNMISGGLHAGGNLDFQDVLAIPVGAPSYRVGLEWLVRVYRRLGERLRVDGFEGRLVGDEGGFGPRLPSNRAAVGYVVRAIEDAQLEPARDMAIAIDVAATHFFQAQAYRLASDHDAVLSSEQMVDLLSSWVDEFPIVSIEDGLAENDWVGWQSLTRRLGDRVQLVGDDLFTTNATRVRRGTELQVANSVLIKVNQIGTLSETFETIQAASAAGYSLVVSARSGETEDTTIADLAVAVAAEQIKIGSIVRSERLAKYNQLLRIEERVGRVGQGE
jgi:enolase